MEAVKNFEETGAVELGALLDAGDGAVVTLVAGHTRLVAHRAVLAARSPVFAAMFGHDTLEASSGEVAIPDVEGPVLRQLLAYLYTLQAPQVSGAALELLAAADKYCLLALKAHCEQQLVAQLSVENAATIAVTAVRHSCSTLRQAALAFMKAHAFQVMGTKAWADAIFQQPGDLSEVSRLLLDTPAETRAPAAAEGTTTASASASDSDSESDSASTSASASAATAAAAPHQPQRRTPAAAALPSPPPDEAAVSRLRAPAATGGTTAASTSTSTSASTSASASAATAAAAPRQPQRRTPAAAAPPTPQPDAATVSLLRSLSAEQRNSRLREAARQGAVGELRALLAAGADVRARDEYEWTALHYAAVMGRVQAARCLPEAGARVDARSSGQATPLHFAAMQGDAAVVRLLLASSADPNARDRQGRTPLHEAARLGRAEAVAALLAAGADRASTDNSGKTPLDLARIFKRKKRLIKMLS